MLSSTLFVSGFFLIVMGFSIWVAYRWGRADEKRSAFKDAVDNARKRHEIDEDAAGMSDAELVERLRKHQ
jgi:hypothetical protein